MIAHGFVCAWHVVEVQHVRTHLQHRCAEICIDLRRASRHALYFAMMCTLVTGFPSFWRVFGGHCPSAILRDSCFEARSVQGEELRQPPAGGKEASSLLGFLISCARTSYEHNDGFSLTMSRSRLVSPLNGLRSLNQFVCKFRETRFVRLLSGLISVMSRFIRLSRVRPLRFCMPYKLSKGFSGDGRRVPP